MIQTSRNTSMPRRLASVEAMRSTASPCKERTSQSAIGPARKPVVAATLLEDKLDAPSDIVSAWQSQYRLPLSSTSRARPGHHQSLNYGFCEYWGHDTLLMKPSGRSVIPIRSVGFVSGNEWIVNDRRSACA